MATHSDTTAIYYVTDNNSGGSIHTGAAKPWAFNGLAPTAPKDSSSDGTDALSTQILANNIRALLVEKGIFNS